MELKSNKGFNIEIRKIFDDDNTYSEKNIYVGNSVMYDYDNVRIELPDDVYDDGFCCFSKRKLMDYSSKYIKCIKSGHIFKNISGLEKDVMIITFVVSGVYRFIKKNNGVEHICVVNVEKYKFYKDYGYMVYVAPNCHIVNINTNTLPNVPVLNINKKSQNVNQGYVLIPKNRYYNNLSDVDLFMSCDRHMFLSCTTKEGYTIELRNNYISYYNLCCNNSHFVLLNFPVSGKYLFLRQTVKNDDVIDQTRCQIIVDLDNNKKMNDN